MNSALPRGKDKSPGDRGGTASVHWSGPEVTDLNTVGNVADRFAKKGVRSWNCDMEVHDGHILHAPVGSARASAFGAVHGGVWEWCLDRYVGYRTATRGPDGLRGVDPTVTTRVNRGGSFRSTASQARAANRNKNEPAGRGDLLGVRPCRVISD